MSYEDTNCPCGGRKERETMLCGECEASFAEFPDMKMFSSSDNWASRRGAAMRLISMARRRKSQRNLALAFTQ